MECILVDPHLAWPGIFSVYNSNGNLCMFSFVNSSTASSGLLFQHQFVLSCLFTLLSHIGMCT